MTLELNEQREWQFFNGRWDRLKDGSFGYGGEPTDDFEEAFQGYRLAFCTDTAVRDFDAELVVTQRPHTDVGLIFAATDPAHFFLLHFPDTGQASRARHFWVALSEMRAGGALKLLKLQCLPRVTPYPYGVPKHIKVEVRADNLLARIDDVALFDARGLAPNRTGLSGLWSFSTGKIVRASVTGQGAKDFRWNPDPRPKRSWFHPVPAREKVWQMPLELLASRDGEMLLTFGVQETNDQGEESRAKTFVVRSRDGGRSWSEPQSLRIAQESSAWQQPRLCRTPSGRLVAFVYDVNAGHYLVSGSEDNARTWAAPTASGLPVAAPRVKKLMLGPQGPMNLSNGSMLAFLYGAEDLADPQLSVMSWGSLHCRAFATVSQDDGRTWSEPVSVDGLQGDPNRKPADANMDLTEVCGVETTPGRVIALVRPIYSSMMWETASSDFGRTWEPCAIGPFAGYATPNMLRTASGVILVAHRLPGLTIHCSHDDGRSWDQGTMIDSGLWCMGSMLEVEPNRVLYVYWDSFMQLMRAQFLDITDAGLSPTSQ